jgi:hypothetical protein
VIVLSLGGEGEGWTGGESIIKNNVELRRYVLCAWIEDEWDGGEVPSGDTNKNAMASAAAPLGDLIPIWQIWVKHMKWPSKHMGMWEARARAYHVRK